jgi:hypothetical protein
MLYERIRKLRWAKAALKTIAMTKLCLNSLKGLTTGWPGRPRSGGKTTKIVTMTTNGTNRALALASRGG